MPSSLSWRRVTKIRGATCGRPKVKTSCARSTPPDRRSPPSSPTVTLFQRRHTRRRAAEAAKPKYERAITRLRESMWDPDQPRDGDDRGWFFDPERHSAAELIRMN